jgi:hypothetical protein
VINSDSRARAQQAVKDPTKSLLRRKLLLSRRRHPKDDPIRRPLLRALSCFGSGCLKGKFDFALELASDVRNAISLSLQAAPSSCCEPFNAFLISHNSSPRPRRKVKILITQFCFMIRGEGSAMTFFAIACRVGLLFGTSCHFLHFTFMFLAFFSAGTFSRTEPIMRA